MPPKSQLNNLVAALTTAAIALHLLLRFAFHTSEIVFSVPLWIALAGGGFPILFRLCRKLIQRDITADLLAGIAIVTAVVMRENLAGAILVLMLSGGTALEEYAVNHASSVLRALANRLPSIAHVVSSHEVQDIEVEDIRVGDILRIYPHEICPVDGVVTEGSGVMDESYLTGEPFKISKTPGSEVISGAINGDSAITLRATRKAVDSRYAKIREVMRSAEQQRPQLRRLGDQLGAIYAPLSLAIAAAVWMISGDPHRFLAVLVIATPCPLLLGIPIAIIGSISLCARRGIIVKNPLVLEQIDACRTVIFDKTGTLTYGKAALTDILCANGFASRDVLKWTAALEQYSRHPLSEAIHAAAREGKVPSVPVTEIHEQAGVGLKGQVDGHALWITGRHQLDKQIGIRTDQLPPTAGGLECIAIVDGVAAAVLRFRDAPRSEGVSFVRHLAPKHQLERKIILSGDRASEVRYLADAVGIVDIYAEQSPEQKLAIVREETARAKTLYIGDGINDAPALMSATVGIALGHNSDITSESAGVVIMDSSLKKVDEFMHISRRMRTIALESAIGGMALSFLGMGIAAIGGLSPVAGAVAQEMIDVVAVLNALRAAVAPGKLSDF